MKTIYILLTKSNTVLSKLVHFVTADAYTHVSVSFEKELRPLYSSSRKNGRTLFPAGPCIERLEYGYYRKNSHIPCVLYELEVRDEIYMLARQEAEQIITNGQNYHFNIIGLFLCQFNVPYHRRHHFFCSQFVSEVLAKSHALKLPKDSTLMKPSDYMKIPELVCRFRGRLCDLIHRQSSPLVAA